MKRQEQQVYQQQVYDLNEEASNSTKTDKNNRPIEYVGSRKADDKMHRFYILWSKIVQQTTK